jgi:hypothetical protein
MAFCERISIRVMRHQISLGRRQMQAKFHNWHLPQNGIPDIP